MSRGRTLFGAQGGREKTLEFAAPRIIFKIVCRCTCMCIDHIASYPLRQRTAAAAKPRGTGAAGVESKGSNDMHSQSSNVATHHRRSHCLMGSAIADARAIAEVTQWAADYRGVAVASFATVLRAVADVFADFAAGQTGTRAPDAITHEALLADGHALSAAGWNYLQPLFRAARGPWLVAVTADLYHDEELPEAPTVGPLAPVAAMQGAA